jgi:dTDP-4-amino-4,6-dideoxygalactose transaminase
MLRPIAISLSPNTEKDDVSLALKTLFSPKKWFDDSKVKGLEEDFSKMFGNEYKAIAVNSGRSAEYLILKALGIGKKDEVIIQSFTCVVVANPIIWLKAKPVYVDVDESYNIDLKDLKNKITNRTRAIIVQHTFGIPANIEAIKNIVQGKNIVIIEDCAHSLGGSLRNKPFGTWGDVAFFSFGRDKVISSVYGGMILCKGGKLYDRLRKDIDKLDTPNLSWVIQQLLHPVLFWMILPFYNIYVGKVLLVVFQKLRILSKSVSKSEKETRKPEIFPLKAPGALAILAHKQMSKLNRYVKHRKSIANSYFSALKGSDFKLPKDYRGSTWLRFPLRHPKARELFKYCRKRGILLGDWYREPVYPVKDLRLVGYKKGDCPRSEIYADTVINLPTYPTLKKNQADKVIRFIKRWINTK